jgi:multidrug efflux pump subunit AcrA (membrane-fusion protein)
MAWFKAHLIPILIGFGLLVVVVIAVGAGINNYKESAFQQRQAEYQKQIDAAKTQAAVAESQANAAKDQAKAKDAQIEQLQSEVADLKTQTEQKRVVYVASRSPVVLRSNNPVSDADIRAIAAKHNLIIR